MLREGRKKYGLKQAGESSGKERRRADQALEIHAESTEEENIMVKSMVSGQCFNSDSDTCQQLFNVPVPQFPYL